MNALVASIIRTLVPHIVTQIASLFLMINIHVPADILLQLSTLVGVVLFALYYGGVRVLEQQWPGIGILLGLPSSPDTYSKGNDSPAEAAKQTSLAATNLDASHAEFMTAIRNLPAPASTTFPDLAVAAAEPAATEIPSPPAPAPEVPLAEVPGETPA